MNQLIETGDFEIGPWRVRPSRSEVEAEGRSVRLEPRVMGVLVALARRQGATVARDRLIEEVWAGRVVTDDAVQRCIAALRKVLRSRPGADIETIPKLGYALKVAADAMPAPSSSASHESVSGPGWTARLFTWPAITLGLAVLFLAGLWWLSADIPASSQRAASVPRARPLTALPGREVQPALSPSGGQVAFVWSGQDGRNSDIYVKTVNGEGLLRLTDDPATDLRPTWSADGGEIAFVRVTGDQCTLFSASALGGPARRIADCGTGQVRSLDWSSDGATFAFASAADDLAPASLKLIDARTGEQRAVSAIDALQAGIEDARFSPDARQLAFAVSRALGVEDVHVYRFADRSLRRLTFDRLKIHNLDWSADGGAVVFSSNRGGPFRLWQVPVTGGEPRLVPGAGDAADDPSVAASGRIAYEVWREDAELVSFDLGQPSAEPRAIASSTRFEWDAKVSPDGSRLAFISDRSGAAEVWVAARDGAQPQRLTSFAGPYTHSPRWSPDGTRLSFVSPVSGRMNLFVMAPGDASPRRIGAEDIDYLAPAWSADGESLFVGGTQVRADARDHAIWRVPVDGGVPVRVDAAGARNAQVSDDGKHLYYTKVGEPGLWRRGLTVHSSEERVIADLTPVDWNNWVVTRDAIFYVRRPAEAVPELMRFAVASQESHLVRALPRLLYKSGLWISADERELIATIVVRAESDLALVE